MKRRLPWGHICAAVAAGAVFSAAVIQFQPVPNPLFHECRASEWTADLLSPDYSVLGSAQTALQAIGAPAAPRIRLMLRAHTPFWQPVLASISGFLPSLKFSAPDPQLCRQRGAQMAGLLGEDGRALVPDLIPLLVFEQTSSDAERALVRIGPSSAAPLEAALASRNPELREAAARVLGEFQFLRETSIPPLIEASRDPVPRVRKQAVTTLGMARLPNDRVTRALIASCADSVPEVRAAAFTALGKLGDKSSRALAAIRAGLNDPAENARLHAAKAFWKAARDAGPVVPVLIRILPGTQGWQAAYALGEIGPEAAPAIPALIKVLETERVPRPYRTPPSSASALGQIGAGAIPALAPVLANPDANVRMGAVMAFGCMGRNARAGIPALLRVLTDKDAEVRHAAALTLAGMGATGPEVRTALEACLRADDIYMRSAAAEALRALAPESSWAVQPE